MQETEIIKKPTHVCYGCANRCGFTEVTMQEYNKINFMVNSCYHPRAFNPVPIPDGEQIENSLQCLHCEALVNGTSANLCNGCFKRASFIELWDVDTVEEAVNLAILQELNRTRPSNVDLLEKLPDDFDKEKRLSKDQLELLRAWVQEKGKTKVDNLGLERAKSYVLFRAELYDFFRKGNYTKDFLFSHIKSDLDVKDMESILEKMCKKGDVKPISIITLDGTIEAFVKA